MNKWQPLWLLLCIGLSYGANRALKPVIAYAAPSDDRMMATGALTLTVGGRPLELKLATVHVVEDELRPFLGKAKGVAVMWLRSPEEGSSAVPDLELFLDLEGVALDPGSMRGAQLPVLPIATGSDLRSRLRLPGDQAPRQVRSGVVTIQRVLELDAIAGAAKRSRIDGLVQLTLEGEDGTSSSFDGTLGARFAGD